MEFLLGIFLGVLLSYLFYQFLCKKKPSGTFIIDFSDPDKDVFSLDSMDLNDIYKKKYIILKVETHE